MITDSLFKGDRGIIWKTIITLFFIGNMAKLIFNKEAFYDRIQKRFVKTMVDAANYMQTYITEEKRVYPRVTVRKKGVGITGQIAGSPRDVVDEGKTRDSFDVTIEYQGRSVTVTAKWDSGKEKYIYFGTDKQDPYPWVTLALRQLDLKKNFINGTIN